MVKGIRSGGFLESMNCCKMNPRQKSGTPGSEQVTLLSEDTSTYLDRTGKVPELRKGQQVEMFNLTDIQKGTQKCTYANDALLLYIC